jgi:PGF-CTERM protein
VTRSIDVSTASSSGPLGGPPLPSAGDSSSEPSSSDTASFELRLDVENRVAGGTALPISLDVENVGSSTTIETVTITVDGQTIATERVRLSAGGSTTLTATASVPVDAAGQSLAIEATAGTASDSATVRVRGGVAGSSSGPVAIETVEFPAEAEAGAAVSADVTVSNTGDQRVSETIRYRVAGETIADQTLSLEPGESTTVTLAGSVPNDLDGTVTQTVRIGAEEQSESLRLSESGHSSSIPGFGVLVAMFALILAAGVRVFELRRQ